MNRTERLWRRDCDRLGEFLDRLRGDGPGLLTRAAIPAQNPYPSSAAGVGGHGVGDHADPTGDKAVANLTATDELAGAVAEMRLHVASALVELDKADAARARALGMQRVIPASTPASDAEQAGCWNCDRYGVWSIVFCAGRCQPCYRYKNRPDNPQRLEAPREMVLARPEVSGKRRRVREAPPADDGPAGWPRSEPYHA